MFELYPARAPEAYSDDLKEVNQYLNIPGGLGRTVGKQIVYQLLGLLVTLSAAALVGALTGDSMISGFRNFVHQICCEFE